jgi:hypothetical protein
MGQPVVTSAIWRVPSKRICLGWDEAVGQRKNFPRHLAFSVM